MEFNNAERSRQKMSENKTEIKQRDVNSNFTGFGSVLLSSDLSGYLRQYSNAQKAFLPSLNTAQSSESNALSDQLSGQTAFLTFANTINPGARISGAVPSTSSTQSLASAQPHAHISKFLKTAAKIPVNTTASSNASTSNNANITNSSSNFAVNAGSVGIRSFASAIQTPLNALGKINPRFSIVSGIPFSNQEAAITIPKSQVVQPQVTMQSQSTSSNFIRLPSTPLVSQQLLVSSSQATAHSSTPVHWQQAASGAPVLLSDQATDTVQKFRNFLATLIKLAHNEDSGRQQDKVNSIRCLIMNLLEGTITPEMFTTRLQEHFSSTSQPVLTPFLNKALPWVRQLYSTRSFMESVLLMARDLIANSLKEQVTAESKSVAVVREPVSNEKSRSSIRDDDDDLNDVAAMAGVNLSEESDACQPVGQVRSIADEETFLNLSELRKICNEYTVKYGLETVSDDVLKAISNVSESLIKSFVEKAYFFTRHRCDTSFKTNADYVQVSDVKRQLKFLEALDKSEKRRIDETERERLLKAAKSRSKLDDPESEKLKQKAKEIEKKALEEKRQQESNETALAAIGRKKRKICGSGSGVVGLTSTPIVPKKILRMSMNDMLVILNDEKFPDKSDIIFEALNR